MAIRKYSTLEDTENYCNTLALMFRWKLNRNHPNYQILIEKLNHNFNFKGYYLCPVRESLGSRKDDLDSICPCKNSFMDIRDYGQCHSRLFIHSLFYSPQSKSLLPIDVDPT